MRGFAQILVAIILIGCGRGDDGTAGDGPRPNRGSGYPLVFAELDAAPACTAENQSQLIYVKAEQEFRFCDAARWQSIDLRGPAGDPGAVGATGAPGQMGPQGQAGQSGFSLGFVLVDAGGTLIGFPDSPAINASGDHYVVFADGVIGQIRATFGEILPGNNTCHYETTDCSGSCFSLFGPNHPDGNHLLQNVADKSLLRVNPDAANLGEWYYRSRWSGGICEAISDFSREKFAVESWRPSDFELPLRLPLRVVLSSAIAK